MQVYKGDSLLKTYRISLGFQPVGPKEYQGDGRTPEDRYLINDRNAHSLTTDPVVEMNAKWGKPEFNEAIKTTIPLCVADGKSLLLRYEIM